MKVLRTTFPLAALAVLALPWLAQAQQRPMDFMDMQLMKRGGSWTPSPDGAWMLYTVSTPDWQEEESQSDVWVVSMTDGATSARQLTYTGEHDETDPGWAPDGSYFVFRSDRDARSGGDDEDGGRWQLYMMRHDGGEARKVTELPDGVSDFDFSPDGAWLVVRSGEPDQEQLYRMSASDLLGSEPTQLTHEEAGVEDWEFSPDSRRIYFNRADSFDSADKRRREADFSVEVKNQVTPLRSLWTVEVANGREQRLTEDASYSVEGFVVSDDGQLALLHGRISRALRAEHHRLPPLRRPVPPRGRDRQHRAADRELRGRRERRALLAGRALDRLLGARRHGPVLDVREPDLPARGGRPRRRLPQARDRPSTGASPWASGPTTRGRSTSPRGREGDATSSTRSTSSETRCGGSRTSALCSSVTRDDDTGVLLVNYQDSRRRRRLYSPSMTSTTSTIGTAGSQLVDLNPQLTELALGEQTEIEWTSTDGKRVGGVLTLPGRVPGGDTLPARRAHPRWPRRVPICSPSTKGTARRCMPGRATRCSCRTTAARTNYGNAHRTDIVGDYFTLGFDDIMTGVDHLIAEGIVDGDRMGALGWSAGGHWSNWILTHTDRFKAISSGAGTMNWISMYAQSDVQRNRQFYVGDGFLYEDFDTYFDQSPLKYIMNAKTPTMIHVVEGDPRVPSPQSVELHMALKKLDVPTELFMYPGRTHGITQPRNRLVKAVSEMAWMDHYVRGIGDTFEWEQVLQTLEAEAEDTRPVSDR